MQCTAALQRNQGQGVHAVISRARAANLRASSFGCVSACVAQLVVRPISPSADSAFRAPFPHTFFFFFLLPAAVSSLPAACLPACLPACLRNPLATRFGCVSARLAALSRAPNCAAGCQQVVRPAHFIFLVCSSCFCSRHQEVWRSCCAPSCPRAFFRLLFLGCTRAVAVCVHLPRIFGPSPTCTWASTDPFRRRTGLFRQ